MNRYLSCFLLLLILGCATTEQGSEESSAPVDLTLMPRRFISLRQIHNGMTRKEVAGMLDNEIIVGYEINENDSAKYKPLTIKNPYRSEDLQKNSQRFEVVYYLQGVKDADDKISDDELIPMVFAEDRLVGTGWDFLRVKVKSQ